MHNTLPKTEILRGYEAFAEVVRKGVRMRSGCLLCHLLSLPRSADRAGIRMGFAVPKKRVPRAVDRNRIRRLMREVYRMNRSTLHAGAEKAGRDLRIVLVYQHGDNMPLHEIAFQSVEHAWNQVAAKIILMME